MRLKTIWTLPAMSLRTRVAHTLDLLDMTIARHVPKRVAFWVYIHVGTKAMRPNEIVPDARFIDLLDRAEGKPRV